MSNALNPVSLKAFEATAAKAAAYLDACDNGGTHVTLDPDYYQACGCLLSKMFSLYDARHTFPDLLSRSAAAREIAGLPTCAPPISRSNPPIPWAKSCAIRRSRRTAS